MKESIMHKQMIITLDKTNQGFLNRVVGNTRPDRSSSDALRALDEGYRAMAADRKREAEAMEWCDALANDLNDASR